jgi:hypothetical protein
MKSFINFEGYHNCDCGSEVLVVRQYKTNNAPDTQIELSIMKSYNAPHNWIEQLRWIWQIFTTGSIWCDQIILNIDDARELAKQLLIIEKETNLYYKTIKRQI